ncbi:MAG TPA: vitamin B12 dependent-methionine synthase activation domain-containing protein [Planctomycetota bacterium]|nr:vitamin B12 dependent-methionine synthase activation domain-containing protein [Planctomycetota bacterium]HRR81290.1 vitamin B12 dependent-methionine synthase activation domain-containing protein [Planctomycetota bacterium]HRT96004.1 vitamin B12 dependent-methionine synthase activation domain-containing protein [Planctomycetota bacterium]
METLDKIPFAVDVAALMKSLRIPAGSDREREVRKMVKAAQKIARPKAVYDLCFIEHKGEDSVTFGGATFTSRVLRVNLDGAGRVFPFVATCGRELADFAASLDDLVLSFALDTVMVQALEAMVGALRTHLTQKYALGGVGMMDPGSLEDWPLSEQRPLFSVLGDVKGAIGVELTDSLLMVPIKSVSGIIFPTKHSFESCQLCPRETCPNRRAKYDPELWAKRYGRTGQ